MTAARTEISRTVRFALGQAEADGVNGFGGKPAMARPGVYCELEIVCRGRPDAATGYLIDIKRIDDAVRAEAVPALAVSLTDAHPGRALAAALAATGRRLGGLLARGRWHTTPQQSWEVRMADETHTEARASLRQRFELAAAHRLHVESLSDEDNRRVFGKCNNPSGHGHNYRVEPCVSVPITDGPPALTVGRLEELVERHILRPFDHTHLNLDTEEFGPGGLNPTVENIARVFYERLAPAVEAAGNGARLESMSVWETSRTRCTYPG